jgi:hypothetical protein
MYSCKAFSVHAPASNPDASMYVFHAVIVSLLIRAPYVTFSDFFILASGSSFLTVTFLERGSFFSGSSIVTVIPS